MGIVWINHTILNYHIIAHLSSFITTFFINIIFFASGVHWGNFIRDLFAEEIYCMMITKPHQLTGIIEIDEAAVGHKKKYGRGKILVCSLVHFMLV